MLKINALKININTNKGLFGSPIIPFKNGLNIIKGNNSTGKSTVFQAILYGLGLEELIGGKNEKTMQSVLKSEILNDTKIVDVNGNETYEIEAYVIESHILLEITGHKTVTIKRYIKSDSKKAGYIEVFDGPALSVPGQYVSSPMYVHDPGSSKEDNPFGFHPFLEDLIGWNLPEVLYKNGSYRKLYLQNIFPSFVIEQKGGWTDFLASIPYYALNDKETRAIEFVLNLDSADIQRRKTEIKQVKNNLEIEWAKLYIDFKNFARSIACDVKGVDDKPVIIQTLDSIFLTYSNTEFTFTLNEYIENLRVEYNSLMDLEIPTIGEVANEKEGEINLLNDKLNILSVNLNALIQQKNIKIDRQNSYVERRGELENDLTQNKYHRKVKEKGAELDIRIAHDNCPFCDHKLNDSLLPVDMQEVPMQIDENISFLEAQINLISIYIDNHNAEIDRLEYQINNHNNDISETRSQIRIIKTQLTSDNRLPSLELIENRIRLKNRLDIYENRQNEIPLYLDRFIDLSNEWNRILSDESKLSKNLSQTDEDKLRDLRTTFIKLLSDFKYRSKSIKNIYISKDTFMPVVDGYSLKFDSSASDFIRAIWSYTLALKEVSNKYNDNHPNFLMLDEPGTQETANSDLNNLLNKLGKMSDTQSLVFCSFKQSDTTYNESTENVTFKLVDLGTGKYIKKLSE
ncbi:MAG: hypothetical protein HQ521_17535 [Bacteroidetes bacterium]|nr:hypothetical protein [Bacteroidota bacterium]